MATMGDSFKKELFGKEVEGWLGRATPAERERFERVFESIRSISEEKKAPDAHSHFIQATMEKLKQRGSSSSSGRTTPVGPAAAGGGTGWSYNATRVARHLDRPETRVSARPQQATTVQQQRSPGPDAEADRPQSAPVEGASSSDKDAALSQAAARRRAISFGHAGGSAVAVPDPKATATASARTAGHPSANGRGAGFVAISPHVTNYQESYNLRSCYPEVYDRAVQDTKIEVEPNKTFISEWGDSMKVGAEECAKLYMRTTYNANNDDVVKFRTDAEAIREREFFKWMLRQKSFYGDLLSKARGQDLESVMAVATDEQKREILEALRTAHAVADPCFDRTRSHSQAIHNGVRRMEDGKAQSRLQLNTKLRIMGTLEMVAQRRGSVRRPATATTVTLSLDEAATGAAGDKSLKPSVRRPATAGAALMARASSVPRAQAFGEKRDMFRSKAPLTWPSGQTGPHLSNYIEAFGGSKIGAGHARPNSALWRVEPMKPVDASVPYGAVNPHTAVAPLRSAYPVPEGFVAPVTASFPSPYGDTSYRSDFAPRDTADLVTQLRAAAALAENGRKTLERSTIPMGPRTGVNLIPSAMWASEARDSYVQHNVDHREPFERATAMRSMFNGPTASAGKVTCTR